MSSLKTPENGGSETPLAKSPEDWLENQKQIWTKEQELVASMVQVHSDPTINTSHDQHRHDKNSSGAVVVEDNPWWKVLRQLPPDVENDDVGDDDGDSFWDKGNNRNNENDSAISGSFDQHDNRCYFGGVDVGFPNPPSSISNEDEDDGDSTTNAVSPMAVAVYVIIDVRTMKVVYRDHEWIPLSELPPYISTFLAFREIDPLERLVRRQVVLRQELTPSAILVDGNGLFHPRRSGIACFLGVRTTIPTIGIGKTLLWIETETKNRGNSNSNINININKNASINRTGDDDYQWTRNKLDERIDRVLGDVHRRILSVNVETAIEKYPGSLGLAERLEEYKGLIIPKGPYNNSDKIDVASREQRLDELAPFCNGIAIPLEAPSNHNTAGDRGGESESDNRFRFLGAALVGHGGRRQGRKSSNSSASGSKRPIIVSVGHKLSLAEAASITAALSLFRIPEPVRQADLYGRELLRQRKML